MDKTGAMLLFGVYAFITGFLMIIGIVLTIGDVVQRIRHYKKKKRLSRFKLIKGGKQ